jgi:hypothetical protein
VKLADVVIGGVYEVRVSGKVAPVRIERKSDTWARRFHGLNLHTNKAVTLTAARCRRVWNDPVVPEAKIATQYGQLLNITTMLSDLRNKTAHMAHRARGGTTPDIIELREADVTLDAIKARLASLL